MWYVFKFKRIRNLINSYVQYYHKFALAARMFRQQFDSCTKFHYICIDAGISIYMTMIFAIELSDNVAAVPGQFKCLDVNI